MQARPSRIHGRNSRPAPGLFQTFSRFPAAPLTVIYVCKDLKSAFLLRALLKSGMPRTGRERARPAPAQASLRARLVTLCWTQRCWGQGKVDFFFPAVFLLLLFLSDTCRSSCETSLPTFCVHPDLTPGCSEASLMLGITWSSSPRAGNSLPLPKGPGDSLFPFSEISWMCPAFPHSLALEPLPQ